MTRWPAQIAAVAVASVLVNVSIGISYGIPKPGVHDEFAYLLMGDTFAQGRLTNPTHPMSKHFETFHVFHQPTYQGKFPPGQGMFLALGELVGGLPILGVWASLALACAATCWMLGGIVPRHWAFLGGLLLAGNPHITGWWGQSYWGGAVAALGGALLFGSLFRFQQRLLLRDSVLLAVGVALLANTRPFEGAITCLAAAPLIILAMRRWVKRNEARQLLRCFVIPLSVSFLLVGAWMLHFNYQLTGDAFALPYYNWRSGASKIKLIRTYTGPPHVPAWAELQRFWTFFIAPPILLASMLGLWAIVRDARTRFCLLASLLLVGISTRFTDGFPHYIAPITCLISAVIVQGLRSVGGVKLRGRPVGVLLVSVIVVGSFSWTGLYMKQMFQDGPLKGALPSPRHWDGVFEPPAMYRDLIIERLEARPGKDLVLVRYDKKGFGDRFEWVYNGSDIDAAEVVWARKLSDEENERLLAYFPDRTVWLFNLRVKPATFVRIR